MSRFKLIAVSVLALTSACATVTSDPTLDLASGAPETWGMAVSPGSNVEAGWLAEFDDLRLNDLVTEALNANPDLQQAQGRLARARAQLRQATAAQLPSLAAGGSGLVAEGVDGRMDASTYAFDLTASWELDVWGRLSDATDASSYSALSREADLQSVRQLIAANTARAYFLLIEARRLAEVEQLNLERLEETLGFVSIQFERGLRSSEDIALIRADVETSRAGLELAQKGERNAARSIEILVGRYPSADMTSNSALPTRPSEQGVGQPASLLERRPDIIAAKLDILVEHARTKSAEADLLPRLSAQATFDGTTGQIEDLFDPTALAASLLVSGAQTLFDGGARKTRISAAKADREIAIAAYQSLMLDAFNEVETELDRGSVLERREGHLTRALSEAEDALQFSRFRYELGESDLLNVLSIQQRVASLEADLARTQRARLDQYVSLALALGRDI